MRINVWISYNGFKKGAYSGISFPYVALCPSSNKRAEFNSISDIHDEIIRLYDKAELKGFKLGEAIYTQSFFFCDHALLVNEDYQDRIKEYTFCKKFNCPPYPSLQQTPANIIDDFLTIEDEFNNCLAKKEKENTNA